MNSFLTCPPCGTDTSFGVIDNKQDCTLYSKEFSQVCGIILLPDNAPLPADWTSAASWATVLNNTLAGTNRGKYLIGEGEIDAPDGDLVEYPKRKLRITNRVYTVDLTVMNLNDNQYAFLQQLQCGLTDFRFWIETVGGRLFGGPTGIDPLTVKTSFLYSGGRNDKEEALMTLTYESDGDPTRADVPGIADAVEGVVSAGIGVMVVETDFTIT